MLEHLTRRGAAVAGLLACSGLLAAGLTSCTGSGDDGVEVITDLDADSRPLELAGAASFAAAQGGIERVTADGVRVSLGAEYFEPLRAIGWTAPDECSFDTSVELELSNPGGTAWSSTVPFDGPSSDDDAATYGRLGQVVALDGAAPGSAPTTTVSAGPDLEAAPDASDASELPTTTGVDSPVQETTPTEPEPIDPAPTDPAPTETIVIEPPIVALVVVVFEHRSVATLRFTEPVDGSPYVAQDVQPVDGWAPLVLAVPRGVWEQSALPPVELTVQSSDSGDASTEVIDLDSLGPAGSGDGALRVLTEGWRFDLSQVGAQCVPPVDADAALNTPRELGSDVVGQPFRPAPALPEPGEQPADPTAATEAALDAIRAVYDIADVYDEGKAARTEDPENAARIFAALRANRVVEPYLSNLDPVFGAVIFTSPTEASIVYRVGPSYQWEIGRVVLVDGEWKVAIGTLCRDLAAAGYSCPGILPDPRPGPLG